MITDEQLAEIEKYCEASPVKESFVTIEGEEANPEEPVWTISDRQDRTGWENDCDQYGYGLTKPKAEYYAKAANDLPLVVRELKAAREALKKIQRIGTRSQGNTPGEK